MPEILSATLTQPGAGPEKFWINLEQIVEEELATIEEAGEVVDELFDVDPCAEEYAEEQETAQEQEKTKAERYAEAVERFHKMVENRLYGSLCDKAEDGFSAEVKLTRSHQLLPYNLLPQGCRVVSTKVGSERKVEKIKVENAESASVQIPADLPVSASWSGSVYSAAGRLDGGPEIRVEKGNVFWSGLASGTVSLSWEQPYHLLEIETDGEDAALTALFRFSADEITIEPPPQDDEITEEVCEKIDENIEHPPEEGDCIAEKTVLYHCDCSDKRVDTNVIQTAAPCSDGDKPGTVVSRSQEKKFINCFEEDEVHDPAYYNEKCCEPPEFPLPECKKKYRVWNGKGLDPERAEQIRRTYGEGTRIVMVGPDPEPCGTLTLEQDVKAKNCCDGVPPLVYDEENSAEVAPENGWCDVYLLGGNTPDIPIKWAVRGDGFYTDPNHTYRDAVTTGRKLRIYTKNSCGTAAIYATDGCSSVSFYVRGFLGSWVEIAPESVPFRRMPADEYVGRSGVLFDSFYFQATAGKYKVWQAFYFCAAGETASSNNCENACNKLDGVWTDFIGEAKTRRLPHDAPMLIDDDNCVGVIPADILLAKLQFFFSSGTKPEQLQTKADAFGATKACANAICDTGALVFAAKRDALYGNTVGPTTPKAWEWQCGEGDK